jgi:hypothetical protein
VAELVELAAAPWIAASLSWTTSVHAYRAESMHFEWLRLEGFGGRVAFATGHARSHPLVQWALGEDWARVYQKPMTLEDLDAIVVTRDANDGPSALPRTRVCSRRNHRGEETALAEDTATLATETRDSR